MMGLKEKLNHKELTMGSWITIAHSAVAEIMAHSGFDWLVIDMEHAPIGIAEAAALIRTIDLAGLPALCRLPGNDPAIIKHVLDAGAAGIIIPMIESREEALRAVASSYYPPRGNRGVGLARAQAYGSGFEEYRERMDDSLVVIAMIETNRGLDAVEDIAATPGIDGLLIGPYDLSASLGVIGQLDHPDVQQGLIKAIAAAAGAGIGCGLHVVHPDRESVTQAVEKGFSFLAVGVDMIFLDKAAKTAVQEAKNAK